MRYMSLKFTYHILLEKIKQIINRYTMCQKILCSMKRKEAG